jgi:hypothetical protein
MSGKLTAEQVRKAIFNNSSYTSYDGARYHASGISIQAIADELNAALGRIDEPDTIRNELADGGLIADVLAPVCVDEKERRAFERGRIRERFAQQIFKEATS